MDYRLCEHVRRTTHTHSRTLAGDVLRKSCLKTQKSSLKVCKNQGLDKFSNKTHQKDELGG